MNLEPVTIQAVKSISLRHLVVCWQKLRRSAELPPFDHFNPGVRAHDPQRIVVWSVKEKNGARTFEPAYKGAHLIEAFGARVHFNMIASQALRDLIVSGLESCTASRAAVYMIIEAPDAEGHPIECERLLLPFGSGEDDKVAHIFAAIEASSVAGNFERRSIVKLFEAQHRVTFRGRIA